MSTAQALSPVFSASTDVAGNVNVVHDVGGVAALFDDRCNVVVLKRTLGKQLAEQAAQAAQQPAFALITVIEPDARGLRELGDRLVGTQALAEDIHFWAQVMAELIDCERVGVRLQRVEVAMCPRLHVDKVTVRLVCAFVGGGTEFATNRRHESQRGRFSEALVGDQSLVIERAETGDVVFLKGEGWPGNHGRGARHRSPTATRELPRLVLTLDALW